MSKTGVKTDEKKQHFDDIYVEATPVPYKTRILDALDYVSDDFNRQMFDAHVLPWARETAAAAAGGRPLEVVDLCSCFGNTTLATIYGMSYDEIRANWADEAACRTINAERRLAASVTGVDISLPALDYGRAAGVYDAAVCGDLNDRTAASFDAATRAAAAADVLISAAALVYLDLETIDVLVEAFARGTGGEEKKKEGYVLVNFLNPFALEKADATKRLLLKHLEFVGSRATRHRRMSALEQQNYPGEEWSLLELWVLKRRA